MLCDGKQASKWYLVKGSNVTVKEIHRAFFGTILTRLGLH